MSGIVTRLAAAGLRVGSPRGRGLIRSLSALALLASALPAFAGSIATPGVIRLSTNWTNLNVTSVGSIGSGSASVMTLSSPARVSDFGLAIPASATITGISVEIHGNSTSAGGVSVNVALSKNGGGSWSATPIAQLINNSVATYTFGGSSNLWGDTWTAAELASSNFWVQVTKTTLSAQTLYVDRLRVVVHYATDIYYSVGMSPDDLKTGLPTITVASGTATLSVAQTGPVGVGDVITYNGTTKAYIKSVGSQTQFVVQAATGAPVPDVTGATVDSIRRTFNTLQAAEDQSDDDGYLSTANLSGYLHNLTWVCYKDQPFTTGMVISGYTTNPVYGITLTAASASQVANGVSQRHTGIAGTGVRIEEASGATSIITNSTTPVNVTPANYLTVEWLELTATSGGGTAGFHQAATLAASNTIVVRNLLVYGLAGSGIFNDDPSVILYAYNNVLYRNGSGIRNNAGGYSSGSLDILNNTVYGSTTGAGISSRRAEGTPYTTLINNIAVGNFSGDFALTTPATINPASGWNLSSDSTTSTHSPAGGGWMDGSFATTGFVSSIDPVDLHLQRGATARNAGKTLFTFSSDVDGEARPSGTAWDIGADEAVGEVFYSIGTSTSDLKTGSPTIRIDYGIATLSVAQTGNLGVGDAICWASGCPATSSKVHITEVLSQTRFRVQTPTGGVPGAIFLQPVSVTQIRRAFNSIRSAVTTSGSGSFYLNLGGSPWNLVTAGVKLTWVCYNDGLLTDGTETDITGYTADAGHYLTLTVASAAQVASGNSQRHGGKAGTGARYWPFITLANTKTLMVQVPYTRIEWLEVYPRSIASNQYAISVESSGTNARLSNLLVYLFTGSGARGISVSASATVRNSILHGSANGIFLGAGNVTVQNCTLYGHTSYGLQAGSYSSLVVENVVSAGSTTADFSGSAFASFNNNLSTDGSAGSYGGTGNLTGKVAANQFVSTSTPDLHLTAGADALNSGRDLSGSFVGDVDGQTRPMSGGWDIGADEASAFATMRVVSGSYTGNGQPGRAFSLGFQPDVVIVDSDQEAVIRTASMVPGDISKGMETAASPTFGLISSLTPDGFTIGTVDARVNQAGKSYHWVAFKAAPGSLKVGTYPGNGTSQTIPGIGFQPEAVMVVSGGTGTPIYRTQSMGANISHKFTQQAVNNGITSLTTDGFAVGNSPDVNSGGTTYHYVAWNAISGVMAQGVYTGAPGDNRNITDAGFVPEYVVVTRSNGSTCSGATCGSAPTHKTAASGAAYDQSLVFYEATQAAANNIQALNGSGFQVGTDARVNSSTAPNTYYWMAFGPAAPATQYRSIGTRATYNPSGFTGGTITVTAGSMVVTKSGGTGWKFDKRGRGDVLTVGATSYPIFAVENDDQLVLSTPAVAGYTGATYTIARQFSTLQAWEDCISGGSCAYFPVQSSSLVSDNRAEVGVAYNDSAFYAPASGTPVLVIDGSTTDPTHTIRLTVDEGFRHNGTSGGTAIVNQYPAGTDNPATPAIRVQDDHVTVEWLEIRYGGCVSTSCDLASDGIRVAGQIASDNRIVLSYLLIHDLQDRKLGDPARAGGVRVASPHASVDVYNSMMWQNNNAIGVWLEPKGPWSETSTIRILNNSVRFVEGTGRAAFKSGESVNTNVLLRNNIAYTSNNPVGATGFVFNGSVNSASSHNLSSSNDTTGPAHSPAGGGAERQSFLRRLERPSLRIPDGRRQ